MLEEINRTIWRNGSPNPPTCTIARFLLAKAYFRKKIESFEKLRFCWTTSRQRAVFQIFIPGNADDFMHAFFVGFAGLVTFWLILDLQVYFPISKFFFLSALASGSILWSYVLWNPSCNSPTRGSFPKAACNRYSGKKTWRSSWKVTKLTPAIKKICCVWKFLCLPTGIEKGRRKDNVTFVAVVHAIHLVIILFV